MEVYRQSNYWWHDSPTHSCGIPLVETQPGDGGPPPCYAEFLNELNAHRVDSFSPDMSHLSKRFKKDVDIDKSTDSVENARTSPFSSSSKEGPRTPVRKTRQSTVPRKLLRSPSPEEISNTRLNDSLDEEDFDMAVASQAIEQAIRTQRAERSQIKPPVASVSRVQSSTTVKKTHVFAKPQIPIVIQRTQSFQRTQTTQREEIFDHQKGHQNTKQQLKQAPVKPQPVPKQVMAPPTRVPPPRPQPAVVIQRPSQIVVPMRPVTRLQARTSAQGIANQAQPQTNQPRPIVQRKTISVVPRFSQNPVRKTNSMDPVQPKANTKKTPLRDNKTMERTKSVEVEDDFYDDSWIQGVEIPKFK
ncbi:unnamed protein product [Bursaphelenchus xylophilus]|uniref:(pine wood nematode) hypothetical protein n=1 Tax=Bursaphelenchus xylophilus TaxID=6326 RepID=A0A7I8X550_BURXY|nr:unnamed protein product [Bursaphelenchus xylophilus]CAG9122487.1 unnamed protein product [Bursaphelenchus xylophilus]